MTNEQAQQVLDEMQGLKPEQLKGESKKLFEAIMKIADERDKIKQEYDRDTHILQNQLDLANAKNIEKEKIIDLIVKVMIDSSICDYFIKQKCKNYAGENGKTCDECIKQYFENKAKEILNK